MTRAARLHADGLTRCPWPGEDPIYVAYHDTEWGVPEFDDRALYEKLILDGFQAGLSWITILRKRDHFRKAFDDFRPEKIARYSPKKIHALMNDAGIVRNRAKIEGAIASAKSYLKIMEEGPGFSQFLWDFLDGKPKVNHFKTTASVPAATPLSIKMSKDCPRAASSSSAPPSSMPSCRRPAWSTTIWSPASAMRTAPESAAALACPRNDGEKIGSTHCSARLAAHAFGPAAQPDRPLAA
jgi:DNA-3-methyladenine glycosylase I